MRRSARALGLAAVLAAAGATAAAATPTTTAGPTSTTPTPTPTSTTPAPTPRTTPTPAARVQAPRASAPGALREPAPRPVAELRVQNRYARNASTTQLFGGVDYLERGDFYLSPGLRLGGTYFLGESMGVELQVSRFFSSLNHAAQQVEHDYGLLPDARRPTWLMVGGLRYAFGFGKMMIGGVDHVVHFQPQALAQIGLHVHDGSFGPSGLAGLGLLVHVTPVWFVRLDGAMTVELESRLTGTATVLGFLPSLVAGGVL